MNDQNESELISMYQSLPKEESPSPELERRIVSNLWELAVIRSPKSSIYIWKVASTIAACLIFFLGGAFFQKHRADSTSVSMSEKTFAFFLMEDKNYQNPRNDAEQQERIELYRSWGRGLREKGLVVNGTKLQDERHIVNKTSEEPPGQAPAVAGYFLIDASDYNQAMEIARTCPHLKFGGTIEVRQIQPV